LTWNQHERADSKGSFQQNLIANTAAY